MKFVTVRDFRSRSARVWRQLKKEEEMVITSNGKPIALLSALTDENLEMTLTNVRKAKALSALTSMQRESVRRGNAGMSMEEINREIKAARSGRKR